MCAFHTLFDFKLQQKNYFHKIVKLYKIARVAPSNTWYRSYHHHSVHVILIEPVYQKRLKNITIQCYIHSSAGLYDLSHHTIYHKACWIWFCTDSWSRHFQLQSLFCLTTIADWMTQRCICLLKVCWQSWRSPRKKSNICILWSTNWTEAREWNDFLTICPTNYS